MWGRGKEQRLVTTVHWSSRAIPCVREGEGAKASHYCTLVFKDHSLSEGGRRSKG